MRRNALTPLVAALVLVSFPAFCQAESSAKTIIPKNTSTAETQARVSDLYGRGNRFLDSRRYAEAERSFLDALKLAPEVPAIHHGLGLVYIQTQDFELAILHLQEALKHNPNLTKTLYALGKAHASIGESEKAKEYYKTAIDLDGNLEPAYQDLAGIYYREKNWGMALDYLNRAKAINPKSPHTLMLIGVTGIHAGRQDIALDSVTELRAIRQMNEARKLEYLIFSAKDEPNPAS